MHSFLEMGQARKNQHDLMSLRHKRLSSACQGKKMVQPGTVINPDYLKLSFENFVSQRMMNLHQCRSQTEPKPSRENMATESVPCKLPILGPRTAVFYERTLGQDNDTEATAL
ncbi:Hypothetical predicted protein [Marmota monax]|uniref:Uncharacterized protein n=1 Tax=Marmota monax TaxID=9995 RepID=A0A5E4AIM4_MARMO|nr:hypothetical protein GHT09_007692 [Marmota monax]VTJ57045.1 Hypothetical predicted protein [Marmota monax]